MDRGFVLSESIVIEGAARLTGQTKQFTQYQEPAMRKLSALFPLAAISLFSPAAAQARTPAPPSLSAADKAHVLGDTFTVVKTVKQMPPAVQKALGLPAKDPLDSMADAGQKFQESDMISDPKLPFRPLVFAAVNAQYCLVYYELGGFAYRREVTLYRLQEGKAIRTWKADIPMANWPATLAQLQAAIKSGKYQSEAASS